MKPIQSHPIPYRTRRWKNARTPTAIPSAAASSWSGCRRPRTPSPSHTARGEIPVNNGNCSRNQCSEELQRGDFWEYSRSGNGSASGDVFWISSNASWSWSGGVDTRAVGKARKGQLGIPAGIGLGKALKSQLVPPWVRTISLEQGAPTRPWTIPGMRQQNLISSYRTSQKTDGIFLIPKSWERLKTP